MTGNDEPQGSYDFDRETMCRPVAPGTWVTTIHPDYNINDNPNGGYAISAMTRLACEQRADHPVPLAITSRFLKPPAAGRDALIELKELGGGRRFSHLGLTLSQDDSVRVEMVATMGDPDLAGRQADRSFDDTDQPDLPNPEKCPGRATLDQGVELALLSRVDVRLDPAAVGETGRAEVAGWIRLIDGRPTDVGVLPLFCDAFPPSAFGRWGAVGWVPTIELTVHVRRRPSPGWIKARFRTDDSVGGLLIENGELWDADGRLVARSRQLAVLLENGR